MILELGGSPGEGIGYPFQYSCASLVAQTVKNLPVLWETCVPSLDWEDPVEKDMAIHSSILAWRIPMDRGAWQAAVHGVAKSSSRNLPNSGVKPRSPALQADSLPSEPPGKPKNTGVGSLSLPQRIFLARNQTGVSCIAGRFFTS